LIYIERNFSKKNIKTHALWGPKTMDPRSSLKGVMRFKRSPLTESMLSHYEMSSHYVKWCDATMVQCNNGAMQQWCDATMVRCNNGAMQHNHNGIMVFVRCNITTMAVRLYGAVQHRYAGARGKLAGQSDTLNNAFKRHPDSKPVYSPATPFCPELIPKPQPPDDLDFVRVYPKYIERANHYQK
jgi:hypothetical protein